MAEDSLIPEVNGQGNTILRDEAADEAVAIPYNYFGSRYRYDHGLAGWKQYDTKQDAHYFGIWVDVPGRRVFSYVEGDRILVLCPDDQHLQAELRSMAEFYGPPPPAFKILTSAGQRVDVYDPRPEVHIGAE